MLRLTVDPDTLVDSGLGPAVEAIARGEIVAVATDTLYGLAIDPRRSDAAARLFAAKGRAATEAIPVIAADVDQVVEWFGALPAVAVPLAREFWPGPLSLLLPAPAAFARAVHAGTARVAVRVPDHAVARSLARLCGVPLTATSANRSGALAAATAQGVADALGEAIAVLVDSGPAPGGPPSTIVDVTGGRPRLIREGAVPWARVLRSVESH